MLIRRSSSGTNEEILGNLRFSLLYNSVLANSTARSPYEEIEYRAALHAAPHMPLH